MVRHFLTGKYHNQICYYCSVVKTLEGSLGATVEVASVCLEVIVFSSGSSFIALCGSFS